LPILDTGAVIGALVGQHIAALERR